MVHQAKEAQVSKDMEELRSAEPDSPVFQLLEQVRRSAVSGKRLVLSGYFDQEGFLLTRHACIRCGGNPSG